jgi:hypothetical protein
MNKPTQIIYIAGYGRSGSTLLERLLQCEPNFHPCGEMSNFFKVYGANQSLCSCGQSLEQCEYWGNVAKDFLRKGFSLQGFSECARAQKKREALPTHGGSFFPIRYQQRYAQFMKPFLDSVVSNLPPDSNVLIDSSKTAYSTFRRPLALSQLGLEYRVRVIHLVRDFRGVAQSIRKGLNRKLEAGEPGDAPLPLTRAMLGWFFGNMAASRLKHHLGHDHYYLLRYEDLVEDPVQSLKSLELFLQMNLGRCIVAARKAREGSGIQIPKIHQLSGNRMRFGSELKIRPDYAWKENMNKTTSFFTKTLLLPMMKKYGYLRR